MRLTLHRTTIQMQVTTTLVMKTVKLAVVTKRMTTIHIPERKQIKLKKTHPLVLLLVLMKVNFLNTLIECFAFSDNL